MGFTYKYSPYPLNANFIKFYPDPNEPEFADGIPEEPEFDINPVEPAISGEPGAFSFKLKLTWEALLKTNEPLFQENEDKGYKVSRYAVNIFEDPKQLCRRLTFYAPGESLLLDSLGEPSNFAVIANNNYSKQTEIGLELGFEPDSVYLEPSTPEGARFGNWLTINEYGLTPPEPQGLSCSIIPGKPACFIKQSDGSKKPTGYQINEPEWKFLEPSCINVALSIGWYPCTGYHFPNEIVLDGVDSYVTTGPLVGRSDREWTCYDCGVCFKSNQSASLATKNLERIMIGETSYEAGGYHPSIPTGFPQPWGKTSTNLAVPQPAKPYLTPSTGESGQESESLLGKCMWGNWGPNRAEPDYRYTPPWSNYLVDEENCRSCDGAMTRNGQYSEPEYENILLVDGFQNEKYNFNSVKTLILNQPDANEPTPRYTGTDSCYGRIDKFSCKPGDNNSINYWFNDSVKSCIQNSGEPQCLDTFTTGIATPLNIPILNTDINTGRSDERTVIVNDWFNNKFRATYYFIINQVCGSQCSYIPINGFSYDAMNTSCQEREPQNFKLRLESDKFTALSNKPYLAIVNQIWIEAEAIEEELPEDVLFVPNVSNDVSITQACNVGGFRRRPLPEPPSMLLPEPPRIPPPPLPGGRGGPGNVFKLEGLCQGKYVFNCDYVRYRPELSMNYQPIAGHPLPYKYIDTMGSSLAKNRQNANLIINATAHRKNTVHFITRNPNCGEYDQCKPPPKCLQCTGNKNPNNNPI